MKIIVYTDGGSRGNPGPAASGIHITNADGKVYASFGTFLGNQTNNFAEYTAIIEALSWILKNQESMETIDEIECRMDSQLACRQLTNVYKVKHPQIRPLFDQVRLLQQTLAVPFRFTHIPREQNTAADGQVNRTLDNELYPSIQ